MPKISVVIPTKDRLRYLQRAISMFLSFEEVGQVVVVIDGCRDGTLEYVKELALNDARLQYVDNVQNRGLPYSRNAGNDLAECEYVFTAEDDLELTDGFFKTLLAHMHESSADVISGRNIFRLETETVGDAIRRTDNLQGPAVNSRLVTVQTGFPAIDDQQQLLLPSPMLARRSLFREIRFDDGYRVNFWREESDFQLSAFEKGYKLVFCPHAISLNLVIENDRSGVHAVAGVRRAKWVVKNNWRFIAKHRKVIEDEFNVGSFYYYIASFAVRRVFLDVVAPILVRTKRKVLTVRRAGRRLTE